MAPFINDLGTQYLRISNLRAFITKKSEIILPDLSITSICLHSPSQSARLKHTFFFIPAGILTGLKTVDTTQVW
jgi:hypothetical protein